jgi:hypothetical protein
MKQFAKISILIVIIYIAYKYYISNFTSEGRLEKLKAIQEEDSNYEIRAKELRERWKSQAYGQCEALQIQYPIFMQESIGWNCKLRVEDVVGSYDWLQIAKDETNGINSMPSTQV